MNTQQHLHLQTLNDILAHYNISVFNSDGTVKEISKIISKIQEIAPLIHPQHQLMIMVSLAYLQGSLGGKINEDNNC